MQAIITKDDLIETYHAFKRRGLQFLFSKFNFSSLARTKSTFNNAHIPHSHWWIIPEVQNRWNRKISSSLHLNYEQYFVQKYLEGKENLRLLSIGSGTCTHEIEFAKHKNFQSVICLEIAPKLFDEAKKKSKELALTSIQFIIGDVFNTKFDLNSFDVILFHSSLHHFTNIDWLLNNKIKPWLKNDGLLLIHEYCGPNRLQIMLKERMKINELLKQLPDKLKIRYCSTSQKKSVSGPGWLRMIISDPSEAAESETILNSLHKNFNVLEEQKLGGNILMPLLKDISHHFLLPENKNYLFHLFKEEDLFLQNNPSHFLFGVYSKI